MTTVNAWPPIRLKYTCRVNPTAPRVSDQQSVSFVPMESVGERGGLTLEETRTAGDVKQGYTGFRDGDVLVAKITPCFENGKGAIAEGLLGGVGFGTTELHVVRPMRADRRWVFYVTQSTQFMGLGEGSMYGAGGQKRVPPEFVRNFAALTPPLPTQRAIAAYLDRKTAAIDALIEKKQKLLDLLAEKRATLINQAVTKGLDPNVPMKNSGVPWMGEIPAHWDMMQLRRLVVKIAQGWSPQCDSTPVTGDQWGVLKAGCTANGNFNGDENKALPPDATPRPELQVHPGDLIVSRASGSPEIVGSAAVVGQEPRKLMLSDKLFRLEISDAAALPKFVASALGSKAARAQITNAISGAEGLANNLPQARLKEVSIATPPITEQAKILESINHTTTNLAAVVSGLRSSLDRLREYRQALITAAVTGQLDIGEDAA